MDRKKELKEQYRQMKPQMGIVAFTCLASGKAYLACAKDTKGTINSKMFQLASGKCFAKNLQADWQQYGAAGFEVGVLETLDYSEDESKADYSADLQALRELCRERYSECEYI